ncbi:hypothetical protein NO263_05935 [Gluconacetobacter entanii]|uniref:Uncharacterized protein n=1 Tax=Gluconacetobacter entanii TaxID=108528 RepID=A0ABT3K3Y7_9PROT|nr:hypothetical protein [Gluconacetobacter entanii]MCW4590119.1 hypothetical protein [Gluconacetobacter entanii]MCW4594734.1 hypothetical protein [Gluconacetobacter entanii]NPC89297.1 hypothetical protein [Gluconacetobacter entanii]
MQKKVSNPICSLPPNKGCEEVVILVKALPHVGQKRGETVCCAGLTRKREWRRQYPIHFRKLEDKKFRRWQWIKYDWISPGSGDKRKESRRVQEDTIIPAELMPPQDRYGFLEPILMPSTRVAIEHDMSLALVRPRESKFYWKKKTQDQIKLEAAAYKAAATQTSFLDPDLAEMTPCPYAFHFDWIDQEGARHKSTCDDWETSATFYRRQRELCSDEKALESMSTTFNEEYPKKGMAFVLGTHSRRLTQWLLVGVIRLDHNLQMGFGF